MKTIKAVVLLVLSLLLLTGCSGKEIEILELENENLILELQNAKSEIEDLNDEISGLETQLSKTMKRANEADGELQEIYDSIPDINISKVFEVDERNGDCTLNKVYLTQVNDVVSIDLSTTDHDGFSLGDISIEFYSKDGVYLGVMNRSLLSHTTEKNWIRINPIEEIHSIEVVW